MVLRWAICYLLMTGLAHAEVLGYVEQKFSDIHFQLHQWTRAEHVPCFTYTAQTDEAIVEVLRYGMNNLVPFRAKKDLKVTVCHSVAAFDEGFEIAIPAPRFGVSGKN